MSASWSRRDCIWPDEILKHLKTLNLLKSDGDPDSRTGMAVLRKYRGQLLRRAQGDDGDIDEEDVSVVATGRSDLPRSIVAAHAKKGRPDAGRPFLVEVVGQRPLPKVGVIEPTVACCWMSCTQSW